MGTVVSEAGPTSRCYGWRSTPRIEAITASGISGIAMAYRHTIDATSHVFAGLRELMAKATPPRSGDRLAGIAADSAEEMIAARMALADMPLTQFLQETVIPYEDDEVTRLIIDSHDMRAFAPIASLTVGSFRDFLLSERATRDVLK